MYSSADQRATGIEAGSQLTGPVLTQWFTTSSAQLDAALDRLTTAQWEAPVVTAQGRPVPATTIPWLRAREVLVHGVDLDTGIGFAHLPEHFLAALIQDISARRGGVPPVAGPLAERAACSPAGPIRSPGHPTSVPGCDREGARDGHT